MLSAPAMGTLGVMHKNYQHSLKLRLGEKRFLVNLHCEKKEKH
jgi:hypothetical protein